MSTASDDDLVMVLAHERAHDSIARSATKAMTSVVSCRYRELLWRSSHHPSVVVVRKMAAPGSANVARDLILRVKSPMSARISRASRKNANS
jgi:hypothetical protein